MKLADFQPSAARKILVYGAPKTGKTDLVLRLAEKKRLWWLDFEDGIKTVFNSPRIKKEWWDRVEYFRIPDTQILPVAARTMLKIIKGTAQDICHEHGVSGCLKCKQEGKPTSRICLSEFTNDDVLVLDSVTQLSSSAMNDIQKDVISKDIYDKKPDWDDYANQGRILDRIFSIVQQAPFNCVAISHEQMVEMEDKTKKITPIGGTRNYSKDFAKFWDDVVYCEIVNGKHKYATSTGYKNNVTSGSRANIVLEKSENPNLLELF